jgi:hypothetical protein
LVYNSLAPICLFVYSRPIKTKKTIKAIKNNFLADKSDLFIFSDGPKDKNSISKVKSVRSYLENINGFKSINIIKSPRNKGLADSIIYGVDKVINNYGKVIILEDDLVTQPNFLDFMNQALNFYKDENQIQSINGYSLKLKNSGICYFQVRPFSWGWGTWIENWDLDIFNKKLIKNKIKNNNNILQKFKASCGDDVSRMLIDSLSEKIDSWYIRWAFNHFINNNYSVYPNKSLIKNIGFDDSATHCSTINPFNFELLDPNRRNFSFNHFKPPTKKITNKFLNYFTFKHKLITRLRHLATKKGRKLIIEEIKKRFIKND